MAISYKFNQIEVYISSLYVKNIKIVSVAALKVFDDFAGAFELDHPKPKAVKRCI